MPPRRPTREKTPRQLASQQEDRELIARALAGDQKAFTRIQKKYARPLELLIKRMIRSEEDARDLVQETFVKAFRALESYRDEYAFSTWLFRIGSNACIDSIRRKRIKAFSIDQPIPTRDGEMKFEIPDTTWVPGESILGAERTRILEAAVASLPEKYRRVIMLRHVDEMEYADIAKELKLPLGTVKVHLFRARAMLYAKLKGRRDLFRA